MKYFFLLLVLTACKTPDVKDINPLNPYLNPVETTQDIDELKDNYLLELNQKREDLNLSRLMEVSEIMEMAQLHAEEMASGKVSFSYDGQEERCSQIRTSYGNGSLCQEVIAKGAKTASDALKAWAGSPVQLQKLLNPSSSLTGVGISSSASGVLYWSQILIDQ